MKYNEFSIKKINYPEGFRVNFLGWAYTDNENEKSKEIQKHYKETDFSDIIHIDVLPVYYHKKFKGKLKEGTKLTALDVLIYADNGSLCFGGNCLLIGNEFSGSFSTD